MSLPQYTRRGSGIQVVYLSLLEHTSVYQDAGLVSRSHTSLSMNIPQYTRVGSGLPAGLQPSTWDGFPPIVTADSVGPDEACFLSTSWLVDISRPPPKTRKVSCTVTTRKKSPSVERICKNNPRKTHSVEGMCKYRRMCGLGTRGAFYPRPAPIHTPILSNPFHPLLRYPTHTHQTHPKHLGEHSH